MNKIYLAGIGFRPLDNGAKKVVLNSRIILASNRLFEVFKGYDEFEKVRDRIVVINNINEMVGFISSNLPSRTITLLASGDPLFFGIGRKLIAEFGKDRVEIFPDLSSIQVAFSRIKELWDDALFISLHGGATAAKSRGMGAVIEDIPELLEKHPKIAILTDKENNPAAIARGVLDAFPIAHLVSLSMHVCERLGYPDEKITEGTVEDIAEMSFSAPNVVIIQRAGCGTQIIDTHHPESETCAFDSDSPFGLRDDEIQHEKGMITKDEIRAVTIHKLRLPQKGIFWDIGAGSGAISIEAARLSPRLSVFAIERDQAQIAHIRENSTRFNLPNVEIIQGEAPEAVKGLPPPYRVFIGGSGGRLAEIVESIHEKMPRGLVVINAATLETLNEAMLCLEDRGFQVAVTQVSISRSKVIGHKRRLSALNPVFIVRGKRA